MKTISPNILGYLEIKIKNDPKAEDKLKEMVLSSLEMKYRITQAQARELAMIAYKNAWRQLNDK